MVRAKAGSLLLLFGIYVLGILGIVASGGGGGGGDDSDSGGTTGTASVTFPAQAQNVNFVANVPQDFTTVTTIDFATLPVLYISRISWLAV